MASSLTLEVAGPDARRLGSASRKTFTTSGGTIGRLPDNAWVLPDQHISGRHAVIRYSSGTFYLVDTSSNGVFVNSPENRLQKNQPYALKQGDRVYIDAYEIRVTLEQGRADQGRADSGRSDSGRSESGRAEPLMMAPAEPLRGDLPSVRASGPLIPDDPFADDEAAQTAAPLNAQPVPLRPIQTGPRIDAPPGFAPLPHAEVDPMRLLGLNSAPRPVAVPKAEDLLRRSPLSDSYRPPAVRIPPDPPRQPTSNPAEGAARSGIIPVGYDPLASEETPVETAVNHAPVVAAATTLEPTPERAHTTPTERTGAQVEAHVVTRADAQANTDFAALLAAAGIENAAVTPEVIESFGRILRIVVSGTMDLLRVREGVKDEFRMKMTTFKASDNNPLKFSANVEDALHNLLVKRNAAYLAPVDAFRDAFQDARNHQVAMFEGLRAAFHGMLRDFDPQVLEANFDKVNKGSLLSGRRKNWDLYREWYESIAQDADSAFRTLFGEEFARAYEEQMQRLKNRPGTS